MTTATGSRPEGSAAPSTKLAGYPDNPYARLWRARWLFVQWVRRDFIVRYRQSLLGLAWSIVQPAVLLLIYGLVFTRVLHVHAPHGSYIVFAYCGLAPWTFVVNAISWGTPSLTLNASVVKQVYFPRAVVPLAAGGVIMLDLLVGTGVLLVLQLILNGSLRPAAIAVVPAYLGMVLLVEAVVVFCGILSSFVRDLRFVIPLVLQAGFIATPVMYPLSEIKGRTGRTLMSLNPMTQVIGAVRRAVISGAWPSASVLGLLVVGGAAALALALAYAHVVEDRIPDLL